MTDDQVDVIIDALCKHFDMNPENVKENDHLWDDYEADDLAYIEILEVIEEQFDCPNLHCLEHEDYRYFTVKNLIDHIDYILDPKELNEESVGHLAKKGDA